MSKKSAKIATLIAGHADGSFDPHYLGYFDCFNRGLYYEAHDVLEELWLAQGKAAANYAFYKGLIQLAGAFVHLQKNRLRPSVALFNLAEANLRQYPAIHERLDLGGVHTLIGEWRGEIERSAFEVNPLGPERVPMLALSRGGI